MKHVGSKSIAWSGLQNACASTDSSTAKHIMLKFGLSIPQASIDLRDFQKLHPDVAEYDLSAKVFRNRGVK